MCDAMNPISLARDAVPPGRDDDERAARESSASDFAALYQQYYPRVFSYVMRTLMNRPAAEDVTSEAFFRAFRKFSTFEPRRGSFSSWIYRIATNALQDHFRRQSHLVALDDGDKALEQLLARRGTGPDAAGQLEQLEAYRSLHMEIQKLKPVYRIVIVLHYFEERSIREIAGIMGTFAPTVRWRLHQARRHLARQLNQEGRSGR